MTGKHGTPEERLWRHVDKTGGCWVWTAGTYPAGYGSIKVKGKMLAAHRLSWEIHHGPIPPGLQVLHRCDNRPCVRPDHLWLGTNADNVADKVSKGRSHFPRSGESKRKLTPAQVAEVLRLVDQGVRQHVIAEKFQVVQATISRTIARQNRPTS